MSGDVFIKKSRITGNFTMLPNALIRDKRLPWPALGLLSYLISLPPDFRLSLKNLAVEKPGSKRDATRTALRYLQDAGYVEVVREREKGKFTKTIWHVSDVSLVPENDEFPD